MWKLEKTRLLVATLLIPASAIGLLVAGCASSRPAADPNAPPLHPRLTHSAYYEEGQLVYLAVDTVAGSRAGKESYIPLPFILANKTNRDMRLSSESFRLVALDGSIRPLASYEEIKERYRRQSIDARFSAPFYEAAYQRLEINTGFSAYMRQPFPLYGAQGLRRNTFTLGGNGYVEGTLYFPRGDLESVSGKIFELDLGSPDLRDTILLRFKIP